MNWQDDPVVQRQIRVNSARNKVLRSMLLWMPIFLACLGGMLWFGFDRIFNEGDRGGTWFLIIVLGGLSLLFGFQAIQSLFDYIGEPTVATGIVSRRWARNDSLILRTHYIRMGKHILHGDAFILDGIKEGDRIEATFYPHSAVLIWAEKKDEPLATE